METVRNTKAERGLDRYVAMITDGLGVTETPSYTDVTSPAIAYIELAEPFPLFPNRPAALLWDETFGWAAAIEAASGRDWVMVAYLGMAVLPHPDMVVAFARRLQRGNHVDGPFPPHLTACDDLAYRLAAYAPSQH
ncbi:MAG: hypothetical protein GEU97_01310 [Actinophytocola sp.]|nr:hypothetical protein [Actinophytocola sp.]